MPLEVSSCYFSELNFEYTVITLSSTETILKDINPVQRGPNMTATFEPARQRIPRHVFTAPLPSSSHFFPHPSPVTVCSTVESRALSSEL